MHYEKRATVSDIGTKAKYPSVCLEVKMDRGRDEATLLQVRFTDIHLASPLLSSSGNRKYICDLNPRKLPLFG